MDRKTRNNLIVRALSGVLVVAAVVVAVNAGWLAFSALMLIVGVFATVEFTRLAPRAKMSPLVSIPIWVACIVLPVALLAYLHILIGPWTVLWYIFIIWMNDIGAYLVGVTLGRCRGFDRKLCPRVSPLKTWTGFFGGLTIGVGTGVAAALLMGWNVWFWVGLAVVAVITGVAGDLMESMLKRAAGVKDSGTLIPGHGGMLDRFDALLFSMPFVFVYFIIFA